MSAVIAHIEAQLQTEQDPVKKVDLVNQLVIESRDNDAATSMKLVLENLEQAEKLDHKKGIAYGILNRGYLYDFQGQKDQALADLELARKLFTELDDKEALGYTYKYLCWYYWGHGEMNKALKMMLKGLKLNEGSNSVIEGWALFVIGVFYTDMKDYSRARDYLNRALDIFNPLDYEHGIGRTLNGLSTVCFELGEDKAALELGLQALDVHRAAGYQMGLARSYNDLGRTYTRLGDFDKAAEYLNDSLEIRKKAENRQAVITTLIAMGDIYFRKQDINTAMAHLDEADKLAVEISATAKRLKVLELKMTLFESMEQPWEALELHKIYTNLKEDYLIQDAESRISGMEAALNEEKKEREIEKGRLRNARLKLQKQRVELLFGQQVSPAVVKTLLNKKDKDDIQRLEATIMFLDIRNFTVFARDKDPEEVIAFQNAIFSPLIEIITKHKGIVNQFMGDGFMASFGLPVSIEGHAQHGFNAGLDIISKMSALAKEGVIPETRVGIGLHTGEVITGNIGNKIRKQYSIAGENVIVAARLEQLNKTYNSQMLISEAVYDSIDRERVSLESLGAIDLKGFDEQKKAFKVL